MVHEIQIYSRIHDKPQSRKSGDLLKIKKINIVRKEWDTKSLFYRILFEINFEIA